MSAWTAMLSASTLSAPLRRRKLCSSISASRSKKLPPPRSGPWLHSMRNPGLPKVAIFGVASLDELPPKEQLRSHHAESYEADEFAISVFADDSNLDRVLAEVDPQAIVSVGVLENFRKLLAAPYYIRRKWIHKNHVS